MGIKVEDLSFAYAEKDLLQNISFSASENEIACLLGPNGTGKTTLLRCILGLNKMRSGKVSVDGRDLSKMTQKERFRKLAYVPQNSAATFSYTVMELLLMGRNPHREYFSLPKPLDEELVFDALGKMGIEHLAERYFGELSGGERQMVLIARALVQEAKILLLDEPTAALDYGNQLKLLQMIGRLAGKGYTIIMTSHYPSHALWIADRAILLKGGRIMQNGVPRDVVTSDALSSLYDAPIKVASIREGRGETRICFPVLQKKEEDINELYA